MGKPTTAVAKTESKEIALPDYIKRGDTRGAEEISPDDVQMPRLALAQQLSPEVDEMSTKYVPGLKFGNAFNSLSGEIYSKGASLTSPGDPVEIVVVKFIGARHIEFFPVDQGGGIKDYRVPSNDPRTEFGPKGEKPVATKFMEFLAVLPASKEPVALSFKGSGLKTAKLLNSLLQLARAKAGGVATFAFKFVLTPTIEKDGDKKWSVFTVKAAGMSDQETYEFASSFYDSIKTKTVVVDTETEKDGDTPF